MLFRSSSRMSWWLRMAGITTAAFGYFWLAHIVISGVAGVPVSTSGTQHLFRVAIAAVLAYAFLIARRRRYFASTVQALRFGMLMAVIAAITDHLMTGLDDQGIALARTVSLMVGLPLLALLAHVTAERETVSDDQFAASTG